MTFIELIRRVTSGAAVLVALVALLVCGGCQSQTASEPLDYTPPPAEPVAVEPEPNPLTGTSWEIRTAIGDVTRNFDEAIIYFAENGEMRTSIERKDGSLSLETSFYEVIGNKIRVTADLGYRNDALWEMRGNDELVIDTTRARLICRRSTVIPDKADQAYDDYVGPTLAGFEVAHPLAGTKWDVVTAVGNINTNFDAASLEFTTGGNIIVRIHRPDGTVNVDESRYRGDALTITIVGEFGRAINAEYRRHGDELRIEFPNARVTLRRAEVTPDNRPS